MRKQHIAFLEERIDSKVQVVEVYGCWFWSCGGECYPRMLGFLSNEIIIVIFCQYLRIEAQWKNLNSLKLCQTLRRKEGTDYKINWEIRISCTVFELCVQEFILISQNNKPIDHSSTDAMAQHTNKHLPTHIASTWAVPCLKKFQNQVGVVGRKKSKYSKNNAQR